MTSVYDPCQGLERSQSHEGLHGSSFHPDTDPILCEQNRALSTSVVSPSDTPCTATVGKHPKSILKWRSDGQLEDLADDKPNNAMLTRTPKRVRIVESEKSYELNAVSHVETQHFVSGFNEPFKQEANFHEELDSRGLRNSKRQHAKLPSKWKNSSPVSLEADNTQTCEQAVTSNCRLDYDLDSTKGFKDETKGSNPSFFFTSKDMESAECSNMRRSKDSSSQCVTCHMCGSQVRSEGETNKTEGKESARGIINRVVGKALVASKMSNAGSCCASSKDIPCSSRTDNQEGKVQTGDKKGESVMERRDKDDRHSAKSDAKLDNFTPVVRKREIVKTKHGYVMQSSVPSFREMNKKLRYSLHESSLKQDGSKAGNTDSRSRFSYNGARSTLTQDQKGRSVDNLSDRLETKCDTDKDFGSRRSLADVFSRALSGETSQPQDFKMASQDSSTSRQASTLSRNTKYNTKFSKPRTPKGFDQQDSLHSPSFESKKRQFKSHDNLYHLSTHAAVDIDVHKSDPDLLASPDRIPSQSNFVEVPKDRSLRNETKADQGRGIVTQEYPKAACASWSLNASMPDMTFEGRGSRMDPRLTVPPALTKAPSSQYAVPFCSTNPSQSTGAATNRTNALAIRTTRPAQQVQHLASSAQKTQYYQAGEAKVPTNWVPDPDRKVKNNRSLRQQAEHAQMIKDQLSRNRMTDRRQRSRMTEHRPKPEKTTAEQLHLGPATEQHWQQIQTFEKHQQSSALEQPPHQSRTFNYQQVPSSTLDRQSDRNRTSDGHQVQNSRALNQKRQENRTFERQQFHPAGTVKQQVQQNRTTGQQDGFGNEMSVKETQHNTTSEHLHHRAFPEWPQGRPSTAGTGTLTKKPIACSMPQIPSPKAKESTGVFELSKNTDVREHDELAKGKDFARPQKLVHDASSLKFQSHAPFKTPFTGGYSTPSNRLVTQRDSTENQNHRVTDRSVHYAQSTVPAATADGRQTDNTCPNYHVQHSETVSSSSKSLHTPDFATQQPTADRKPHDNTFANLSSSQDLNSTCSSSLPVNSKRESQHLDSTTHKPPQAYFTEGSDQAFKESMHDSTAKLLLRVRSILSHVQSQHQLGQTLPRDNHEASALCVEEDGWSGEGSHMQPEPGGLGRGTRQVEGREAVAGHDYENDTVLRTFMSDSDDSGVPKTILSYPTLSNLASLGKDGSAFKPYTAPDPSSDTEDSGLTADYRHTTNHVEAPNQTKGYRPELPRDSKGYKHTKESLELEQFASGSTHRVDTLRRRYYDPEQQPGSPDPRATEVEGVANQLHDYENVDDFSRDRVVPHAFVSKHNYENFPPAIPRNLSTENPIMNLLISSAMQDVSPDEERELAEEGTEKQSSRSFNSLPRNFRSSKHKFPGYKPPNQRSQPEQSEMNQQRQNNQVAPTSRSHHIRNQRPLIGGSPPELSKEPSVQLEPQTTIPDRHAQGDSYHMSLPRTATKLSLGIAASSRGDSKYPSVDPAQVQSSRNRGYGLLSGTAGRVRVDGMGRGGTGRRERPEGQSPKESPGPTRRTTGSVARQPPVAVDSFGGSVFV